MPKGKAQPKHVHFQEGAKVLVKLNDGQFVIDRFVKQTKDWIILKSRGKLMRSEIRTITRGYQRFLMNQKDNEQSKAK